MAKSKAPFPIYCVEQREVALCDDGADCDPHENPGHHVRIDLTEEARAAISALVESLEEVHEHEIRKRHYGDRGGAASCSYCQAIKGGKALLKFAEEV